MQSAAKVPKERKGWITTPKSPLPRQPEWRQNLDAWCVWERGVCLRSPRTHSIGLGAGLLKR